MKRIWFVMVLISVLILSACSSGGKVSRSQEAALSTPAGNMQPFSPTQAEPTAAPKASFTDNFDSMTDQWTDPFWVTSQAKPGQTYSKFSVADGKLIFDLQDKETYVYKFYKELSQKDVALETKFVSKGQIYNGIAIVCRASADFSAWYEFRVTSTSTYSIYRYDRALKEKQDKNPYVELKKGGLDINTLSPSKENVFRGVCKGNTLTLEVNGKTITTVETGDLKDAGLVGVGAMSADLPPVNIQFDTFSVATPD